MVNRPAPSSYQHALEQAGTVDRLVADANYFAMYATDCFRCKAVKFMILIPNGSNRTLQTSDNFLWWRSGYTSEVGMSMGVIPQLP